MKHPLLELCHVSKRFDPENLLFSDVNLKVYPGQTYAIEGVSGIGKSTLLHCMAGLDIPSSGSIFFENARLTEKSGQSLRKDSFGFIFQSYNLLEDLSAEENIALAMQIANKTIDQDRINYLLSILGMSKHAKKSARYLSGGEKQRIAIGRALANRPKIIFADELTANLDAKTSESIEDLLFHSVSQEKISLIVATHDQNLAKRCDHDYLLSSNGLKKI